MLRLPTQLAAVPTATIAAPAAYFSAFDAFPKKRIKNEKNENKYYIKMSSVADGDYFEHCDKKGAWHRFTNDQAAAIARGRANGAAVAVPDTAGLMEVCYIHN